MLCDVVLPALSSNDHLISFWNSITTPEDVSVCVCLVLWSGAQAR